MVSTIRFGHFWTFLNHPPQDLFALTIVPVSLQKAEALQNFLNLLQVHQAVVPVPPSKRFTGFNSPQKEWGMETSGGFEASKSLHLFRILQDGILTDHHPDGPARRLDVVGGPVRCLYPRSHPPRLPEVSKGGS